MNVHALSLAQPSVFASSVCLQCLPSVFAFSVCLQCLCFLTCMVAHSTLHVLVSLVLLTPRGANSWHDDTHVRTDLGP